MKKRKERKNIHNISVSFSILKIDSFNPIVSPTTSAKQKVSTRGLGLRAHKADEKL